MTVDGRGCDDCVTLGCDREYELLENGRARCRGWRADGVRRRAAIMVRRLEIGRECESW